MKFCSTGRPIEDLLIDDSAGDARLTMEARMSAVKAIEHFWFPVVNPPPGGEA